MCLVQQNEQLPQLPAGILQQVLSHVPLQHRMGSCSLASRSMHAAAVAATEEINVAEMNSQQKASELCQWLARYGSQALTHLGVEAPISVWPEPMLSLALPNGLQQLQSLALTYVELPDAPDSLVHPKLTSLCLRSCQVRPCSDVFAWVARQLVHLTGLQCLQLRWLDEQDTDPSEAGILAFAAALAQLQQLTSLDLMTINTINAALAAVSSLSQLQELQLSHVGTDEQPLQMQWLPSSLTSVMLARCSVSCAANSSRSSSSGWQLPVVEHFKLMWVRGFEPAQLKQMPRLRILGYGCFNAHQGNDFGLEKQQLVEVLPQLQNLQQLQLESLLRWPSPSICASLTAHSQLTALVLMECSLPVGAVQHMFASGQQLQQLQRLEVVTSGYWQAEVDHLYSPLRHPLELQTCLEYNASLLQADSLNVGPKDLAKLASCCPRFCELKMIWCDLPGPARGEAAGEAAPLLQLTALTALQVAGQYWNDAVVESVLAHMTGEVDSSRC
jgi:hypothetical protein